MQDFKLDLEEADIQTLFACFDSDKNGVISIEEFMNTILGELNPNRRQAVEEAFRKYDTQNRNIASYRALKEAFDAKRHPDVVNGRKIPDEILVDFLEIFEIHHNTFNNNSRTDQVSKNEFFEFYRTVSPNYDDDSIFSSMVRGCWGVRNENRPATQQTYAGGNNDALNSRDRYIKANSNKGTPFGVSQQDSSQTWATSSKQTYRPVSAMDAQ